MKPANIMVAENGEPVVMDFGLARQMDSTDTRVTRSGTIVGTPAYMSPEQVEGHSDALGPASDQYSLGVILYELLTGQLPFQGTVLSVIGQIAHKRPADILDLRPDIDPRLANICKKMMAKKPEVRFKDMAAAAAALNRYLQDSKAGTGVAAQPSLWQPDPVPQPTVELPRPPLPRKVNNKARQKSTSAPLWKRWSLLGGLAALVFVLLAGVIYFTTGDGTVRIDIQDRDTQVTFQGQTFTVDDNGTPIEVSPGQHKLKVTRNGLEFETEQFTVSRNGNAAIAVTWLEGELLAKNGERVIGRERETPKAALSESPDQLKLLDKLEGAKNNINAVVYSLDGKSLFVASEEKQVQQWDLATKQIVRRILVGDYALCLAEHPDKEHIFTGLYQGGLMLWSLKTGRRVREFPGHAGAVHQLLVTPDGRHLLSAGENGLVRLWDIQTGESTREYNDDFCAAAALSPDGKTIAHAAGNKIRLWTLDSGKMLNLIPRSGEPLGVMVFSPDGKQLATGDFKGIVQVWDVPTGQEMHQFKTHRERVTGLVFTHDGQHVISGSPDQTLRVFSLTTGLEIYVYQSNSLCVSELALSPDGQTLASAGGIQRIRQPDGTYTVRRDGDFAIRLWKLPESVWNKIINPDGSTTEIKPPPATKKVEVEPNGKTVPAPQGQPEPGLQHQFAGTQAGQLWDKNSLAMKFCWCPPGKFTMGSPASEKDRRAEENQVTVTLSQGFWLGQYEVTQREYELVMGHNPSSFQRGNLKADASRHPVEQVTWAEALAFCRKLTAQEQATGRLPADWQYTLPTEAQWEYACRAGTATATAFGDTLNSTQANFNGISSYNGAASGPYKNQTTPMGGYPPNAWNLYDMHGNVREWCRDWYAERLPGGTDPETIQPSTLRVNRGGSWFNYGWNCRSAFRNRSEPNYRGDVGLRVALTSTRPSRGDP